MSKIEWTGRLLRRFWAKVEVDASGCWIWTGASQAPGYGKIRIDGRSLFAHRVVFEMTHGRAPGEVVMHACDVPSCVNPAHLREGTHGDNVRDCVAKGRARHARGEQAGGARLRSDDVRAIRVALRLGNSLRKIAAWYGVGHTTIANIKHGATWEHLR